MITVLLLVQVLIAVALVTLILLQHGKGADAGAAFGSGASSTMFGPRGAASFLTRATAVLAALFFINSVALAYYSGRGTETPSVVEQVDFGPEAPLEEAPSGPPDDADPARDDIPEIPQNPDS